MGFQNRVNPWGKLHRSSVRGAWLGNRGVLHNEAKEIIAPWRHKAWIICSLDFKGRKREVFSPNSYSELFFLDEATALSAGHRPCGECRKDRFDEFKAAWIEVNDYKTSPPVKQLDKQLHAERAIRGGGKVTFEMEFSQVPEGAFIEIGNDAFLVWKGQLKRWSFQGYKSYEVELKSNDLVKVLTPLSIVRILQYGFSPQVHDSANTGLPPLGVTHPSLKRRPSQRPRG